MTGSCSQKITDLSPNGNNRIVHSRFLNRYFKRPRPKQVAGDVRLGYLYNSKTIFGLLIKELVQHMLIVGRSGSGKTNILRIMQVELSRLGIPFMSFDLVKYGSRNIRNYIKNLIVLRSNKDFYFNPLRNPPGTGLKEWTMAVCEVTSEIFDIRTASNLFLIKFILSLYEKHETEKSGKYPTILNLNEELLKKKNEKISRNESGYIDTVRNKIDPICLALEETLNVEEGIPIEQLLMHPVTIELLSVKSSEIQAWIISLIMVWITSYRESHKMPSGKLHVFFFDEAAQVLGKGE